jgi:apoptosis-inducing factor 3
VIVGGGAAGEAAAEMLRHEAYSGPITMLSDDDAPPCDRPNLSTDYLAGNAPEEWIPLRPPEFYGQHALDLRLGTRVVAIHANAREVELADGSRHGFGALLLATGAEPVRLGVPGSDLPHIHYLRTLADSRALMAKATVSRRAVVIGASFIGLEVAASSRARGLEVHVVAPEARPMETVFGPKSATSYAGCTRSTVSSSTSAQRPPHSIGTGSHAERGTARSRLCRRRHRGAAADRARRAGRVSGRPWRHGQ